MDTWFMIHLVNTFILFIGNKCWWWYQRL